MHVCLIRGLLGLLLPFLLLSFTGHIIHHHRTIIIVVDLVGGRLYRRIYGIFSNHKHNKAYEEEDL